MSLGSTFTLTGDELKEIFNVRLARYLPANLEKVEPHASGWGISYTFKPFTGRETKPEEPYRFYDDPKLCYQHQDREAGRPEADEDEYELRERARYFLDEVYRQARVEWRNAAHVAELKTVVKDAGDLWKRHAQAKHAVEAAFAYLREPEAATEWQSAVSRLIDTHDALKAAAAAFDDRAEQIAEVNDKHDHEEGYGGWAALRIAGYADAKDWHIVDVDDYRPRYDGTWADGGGQCLQAQAARLIEEQEKHVAKIGRLSGTAAEA